MTVIPEGSLDFLALPGRRSADPFAGLPEMSGADLSVRVVLLDATADRTAHTHPLTAEAFYVVSGRGQLWVAGQRRDLGPGDVALVPAGAPHATLPAEGEQMRLVCFFPHPDLRANLVELDIRPD